MLHKDIRLNLRSLFINWGPQFLIPADWSLNMTCARSYVWFLNFFCQMERVWIVFSSLSYPNLVKQLSPDQSNKTELAGSNLTCQSQIWLNIVSTTTINVQLLKVWKSTSFKIYLSLVMEKLEASNLGSIKPHSKGYIGYSFHHRRNCWCQLPHNHMTNVFISSYRGATVIKFVQ